MATKPKPPNVRSVATAEAAVALLAWFTALPTRIRDRALDLGREAKVIDVWADADHFIAGEVDDEERLEIELFYTRGKWSSRCECATGSNCQHAGAVALEWIEELKFGGTGVTPAALQPVAAALHASAKKPSSFRAEWTPILAAKIGRPLTEDEGRLLSSLASLFSEFHKSGQFLFPEAVLRHGFPGAVPTVGNHFLPLHHGWWGANPPPNDPWELWQYLAYQLEINGKEIPAVFRPMTDTGTVYALLDAKAVKEEIAAWHRAFDLAAPATDHPTHPSLMVAGLRGRLLANGGLQIETRAGPDKPWKPPAQKWVNSLDGARPADFEGMPPAEAALANALAAEIRHTYRRFSAKSPLPAPMAENVLRTLAARGALVLADGSPFAIEPGDLVPEATVSTKVRDRLELRLVKPDGEDATAARLLVRHPQPLYLLEGKVWRGPPLAPMARLPTAALGDARIMARLRATGLRLPSTLEVKVRQVRMRAKLQCWIEENPLDHDSARFHARLTARADDPACEQQWSGNGGWHWLKGSTPPPRRPDDPFLEFDLAAGHAASARFAEFRLGWNSGDESWARSAGRNFPEEFIAWRATLPPELEVEAAPELAGLVGPALRARVEFSALPAAGAGRDWFDLTVALHVEDTTFSPEELALLLKARGRWVRLAGRGWQRMEFSADASGDPAEEVLNRLGLHAGDVLAGGRPVVHRLHALQLATEADTFAARDANFAADLRARAAALAAIPPPTLPPGLRATLRPYQKEGFHFLAHLSAQGFGGVLADDMGLGKTVQALAWLLHLAHAAGADPARAATPFRALIVCPKSVTHGWLTETERFAPGLAAAAFTPAPANPTDARAPVAGPSLVVANYTQLRLQPEWFQGQAWDAVVLDEAQFIKTPTSQTAMIARSLATAHRLALTGTPVENRLLDLWSLFAFAQPGLLGTRAGFARQHSPEDATAPARLHRRVRHFLLRRTKAQVAPELPPRTEDEIVVALEGEQAVLYGAELKRARAQLLGVQTERALDSVRFNVLASLLRLRQICCHPALIDPAHAELPSAKVDALLERLEELRDEGQQVLVFSQFVTFLELIRERLVKARIRHLMLTGQTENRAELVEKFQADRGQTVFLLSLKAAGFGLNLTAASYVILCDPWWNPAVEAQAIDRTHRIGQTRPVIAYRLVAADTVEQKILAMQREKAALAASVVREESLSSVLDLDSLRQILG